MSEELLTESPTARASRTKKKPVGRKPAKKAAASANGTKEPVGEIEPALQEPTEAAAPPTVEKSATKSPRKTAPRKRAKPAPEEIQEVLPLMDIEEASSAFPAAPQAAATGAEPSPTAPTNPVTAAVTAEAQAAPVAEPIAPPRPRVEPQPTASSGEAAHTAAPAAIVTRAAPRVDERDHSAAGSTAAEVTPGERRKSKFERWKERRERFRQERQSRQQGGPGPAPSSGQRTEAQSADGDDADRAREPEKPLGPSEPVDGLLEMTPKGYGFLRSRERGYGWHAQDAYIGPEFIRKFALREGMQIKGVQHKGSRGMQVSEVTEVNGRTPEAMRDLPLFEELKAINPNKRVQLETVKDRLTTRVIDLITPVGRGQRGLIVAPPRAGKTTMLQHIAEAVVQNHPGMHLMILLVDERPEEVTEFKRILPNAEIFASSNDQDVKSHTRIASFAIERAKRLVECGEHVFMLMDSITRLARAFNNAKQGGATMSGGMGVGAMEIPRRLFAAARNTRQAGSLTILATALVETGSRMDDMIFQEFKGTGNMELVLERKIAEQYIYPAVNIMRSGTRREELLLQPFQLDKIHMLRRGLAGHKPVEAMQRVISLLERYPSNAQMLVDLPSRGN